MKRAIVLATVLTAGLWVAPAAADVLPAERYVMGGEEDYGASVSYLGVDTREITADRVGPLKLKEERGVEITVVDQDAPAGKAGLKEHDVIQEFNGQRVEGVEQFRRMIRETPPGRAVTLGIVREGQNMNVQVTLADKHKLFADKLKHKYKDKPMRVVVPPIPPLPPIEIPSFEVNVRSWSSCGLVVENLTPQLGEFFGVKNGEGVLVRSVEKGSAAEAAGFKAGDIIIRVDKERILDRGDWRSALRHRSGKVSVGVVRNKSEQTLSLELPKEEESGWRFEFPDLDFEGIQDEIATLKPEIELTMREAFKVSQKEMQKAWKQARAEAQREMRKAREEMKRMREELRIEVR